MTETEKRLKEIAERMKTVKKPKPKQAVSCPIDPAERELCESCQ